MILSFQIDIHFQEQTQEKVCKHKALRPCLVPNFQSPLEPPKVFSSKGRASHILPLRKEPDACLRASVCNVANKAFLWNSAHCGQEISPSSLCCGGHTRPSDPVFLLNTFSSRCNFPSLIALQLQRPSYSLGHLAFLTQSLGSEIFLDDQTSTTSLASFSDQ